MKINITEVKPAMIAWIDEVVMPQSTPLQKFGLAFLF